MTSRHLLLVKEMEIGSASDTAEVEDETPQDTELKTPVPVRRSVRERKPHAWLTSGQSVVSKSATCIKQTSIQLIISKYTKCPALSHTPPSCKMTSRHLLLVVVDDFQDGFSCLSL
jgi:hypothetical protein